MILIDVQYPQNAVFSFEKGSNRQNHSSSGSLPMVKKSPLIKFPIPRHPLGEDLPTIVCTGVSTPLKNATPSFLPSPLLSRQIVQASLFRQSPLYISFSWNPPSESRIFQ